MDELSRSRQVFHFRDYHFDANNKQLILTYQLDDAELFTETYTFDFLFADYDQAALERACLLTYLMAGVSYYKTFLPKKIDLGNHPVDEKTAEFLATTYQKGLGEFFYVNQLDPLTPIPFKANENALTPVKNTGWGEMIGLGGGKDSLLSVELLRERQPATWSAGHRKQLEPLVQSIGLEHFWVERVWDRKLLDLNKLGALNGHIPISAVLACVGVVTAILGGKRDIVVSNEQSANEPTLEYMGQPINHQYSKSSAFEKDFQELISHHFGDTVRYYSLLRPYSELQIAEMFSRSGFAKYKGVFSSCNQAYTHQSAGLYWCGVCPKCAFVFLALTPFVARSELESLFGKNMLTDPTVEPLYRQLLGIEGEKPLECVGEILESRAAMQLAKQQYPKLAKYSFDFDSSYDFHTTQPHLIPDDIWAALQDIQKN